MSHFTVLVCVRNENNSMTIEEAILCLNEMMEPYQENNMNDCPKEFLIFNNVQEELQEDYANEKNDIIQKYPSFKDYAEEYCGYNFDKDEQAYGYYENPNARWDWYQLGGRWKGMLPVKSTKETLLGKPGVFGDPEDANYELKSDITKISNLDVSAINNESIANALKYWKEWEDLKNGKEACFYTRIKASKFGMLEMKNQGTEDAAEVYSTITKEEFLERFTVAFSPLQCYAVLNEDGWHSPGEMGWWGTSSETAEEKNKFTETFYQKFIESRDPNDWIAVVDCHI